MRTKGLPREWSGSCSATRRSPPQTALSVIYATASAEAVAGFVAMHYALDGLAPYSLLNRGFNDIYARRDAGGAQFVLRLSSPHVRGPADVAAETAFVAYLDAAGVPVAAPLPTRTGALFTTALLPGGPRPAVLFYLAQGSPPRPRHPGKRRGARPHPCPPARRRGPVSRSGGRAMPPRPRPPTARSSRGVDGAGPRRTVPVYPPPRLSHQPVQQPLLPTAPPPPPHELIEQGGLLLRR